MTQGWIRKMKKKRGNKKVNFRNTLILSPQNTQLLRTGKRLIKTPSTYQGLTGVEEHLPRIAQHWPSSETATALDSQRERAVPTGKERRAERLSSKAAGREKKSLSRARRRHRPARETPRRRAGWRPAPRRATYLRVNACGRHNSCTGPPWFSREARG